MIVAYDIGVDGWVPCKTMRKPVVHGYGPIEISKRAWDGLSDGWVIRCEYGLTDTEHLIAAANRIDGGT